MRIRMIGSITSTKVTASCGHEVNVVVPPHDLRNGPGKVGSMRIAEAQKNGCRRCGYFPNFIPHWLG